MPVETLVPPTAVGERNHPLIVTNDPFLLDDLLRLAAAGSAEARVAIDAQAARQTWADAPFVLIGADLAGSCVQAGLPARASVTIVARAHDPDVPWRYADALRAEHIALLPTAEAWLVDQFSDHSTISPVRGRVVAVLGGRGGAGASVLATGLAVTSRRRGLDTLLVDADPYGGGVDLVLGWERLGGLRWPDLVDARGRVNPPALVSALPGEGSLAVLSFDRSALDGVPAPAMAAAIDAGQRGRDLVVADLPRRFDDASLIALKAAYRAYLVVPAELRACAASKRVAAAASAHCADLALVIRGPAPSGITADEIADALELPVAGVLRSEPRLARALESGEPPASTGRGALAQLCRSLLADFRPRGHRVGAR
jgi:secretion/DNA translocation related CpaE-like protein